MKACRERAGGQALELRLPKSAAPTSALALALARSLALALALAPALALALALSLSLSRGEEAHVFDVGCCLGGRFQEDQAVLLRELLPFLGGDGAP